MTTLERRTVLITEGSLLRSIATVAVPVVLTNLLQASYQIVNGAFLGHAGRDSLAAVALSVPMFSILIALGGGLSTAGSVFVAQYAGARRTGMVDRIAAQTLLMVAAVAVAFMALGLATNSALLRLIGVQPDIYYLAHRYLSIGYFGMVPMFGFITIQAMLQAIGDGRYALRVMIASVMLNALLDAVLIFGWGPISPLGVSGAAIATVCAQTTAFACVVARLIGGGSGIRLHRSDFVPDFAHIRRAIAVGVPASIEHSTRTLGSLLLMVLAARFGTEGLAQYGLGMRVLILFFVPMQGLSIATASLIGQNIGAGRLGRAETAAKAIAGVSFGLMTFTGLIVFTAAPYITHLMAPGDPGLVAGAARFIQTFSPFLGFFVVPQVLCGAFRGAGSTGQAMGISLTFQWLMQLPAGLLLAFATPLGLAGVFWSFPVANLMATLLALGWFRWGPWRRSLVNTDDGRSDVPPAWRAPARPGKPPATRKSL